MIAVNLEFDAESKRLMKRLESETPKTFRAAAIAAATRAQNRLRKVMRVGGGVYGVPTFAPRHELTMRMRPNSRPGGVLAEKGMIRKGRVGDSQWVGWVDRVAEWASVYEGAQKQPFPDWQKAALHRYCRALDGYKIPDFYDRPPRMVIDPFAAQLAQDYPAMVVEAYNKMAARRQKRGLEVA